MSASTCLPSQGFEEWSPKRLQLIFLLYFSCFMYISKFFTLNYYAAKIITIRLRSVEHARLYKEFYRHMQHITHANFG